MVRFLSPDFIKNLLSKFPLKKIGITTGYWEDMFYLTLESAVPNREQLCSIMSEKHNAKLLSSSVCDRRSSYDENSTSTLVERWYLTDTNLNRV